jgi:hypothetical protein
VVKKTASFWIGLLISRSLSSWSCASVAAAPDAPAFVTFVGCLVAEDEHLTAVAPGGSEVSILLVLACPQLVVDGVGAAWPAAL